MRRVAHLVEREPVHRQDAQAFLSRECRKVGLKIVDPHLEKQISLMELAAVVFEAAGCLEDGLTDVLDIEPDLLLKFASEGLGERLARLHPAAGRVPPATFVRFGRITTPDQQHSLSAIDQNRPSRGARVNVTHVASLPGDHTSARADCPSSDSELPRCGHVPR